MRLLRKLKFARNDNLRLRAQDFLPIYDVWMNIVTNSGSSGTCYIPKYEVL